MLKTVLEGPYRPDDYPAQIIRLTPITNCTGLWIAMQQAP